MSSSYRYQNRQSARSEPFFGDWVKWLGLDEGEQGILDNIVNKLGTDVNDLCEQIAKSNLSSFHPVDVLEHEDSVEVWVDVPGFEKEQLDVRIKEKALTVSGDMPDSRPVRMYMKERANPAFKRTINLPTRVTATNCVSTLRNGVLRLVLPKQIPEEGVKIPL